jgi:hypothetical protein
LIQAIVLQPSFGPIPPGLANDRPKMDKVEALAVGIWQNQRHAVPMFFATATRAQVIGIPFTPRRPRGEQFVDGGVFTI